MKNKLNFIAKSLLIKTFAVLMIIGMMDSLAFSQAKKIRFARGKSATTLRGEVSAVAQDEFVINGKKGQTMTLKLVSPTDSGIRIAMGENNSKEFTIKLDSSNDYTFTIYNAYSRNYSKYTLYVSIK